MDTITISRDVFDNPTFRSPERLRIWLALLFAADENGEVLIKCRSFAAENGVTYKQVRTALDAFEQRGKITRGAHLGAQLRAHLGAHITICDIEQYKGTERSQGRTKGRSQGRTITSKISTNTLSVDADFVAPEFAEPWQLWLDYRTETKRPYKSEKSERIGYEQLVKKSNNDPKQALEIVKNTIANGYQGLFALKDERKDKRNNSAVRSGDDRYAALERAAATILCSNDAYGCSGNGQG